MADGVRGKKRFYRDIPSMMDPDMKCPINEKEIRLELEERIRETEDGTELAALILAWCQITKKDTLGRQVPRDVQMSMAIKEVMINTLMFILGVAAVLGFLILSSRL